MDSKDEDHIGDTVRIRRPPRVVTDERGRTVWMGQVASSNLRLETTAPNNPYDSAPEIGWPASARV